MLKRPDFMPVLLLLRRFFHEKPAVWRKGKSIMTLLEAEVGKTYIIKEINTDDDEMNSFLFRLGCYSGEPITVVSRRKRNCTVSIKDGRYCIDNQLASAICISE